MDNEFRKDKLTNGCIVQLRNGDICIYLENANACFYVKNMFINLANGYWNDIKEYDDDLRSFDGSKYDIVKICNYDYVGTNIFKHIEIKQDTTDFKEIWTAERECKGIFEEELEEMGLLKDIKS